MDAAPGPDSIVPVRVADLVAQAEELNEAGQTAGALAFSRAALERARSLRAPDKISASALYLAGLEMEQGHFAAAQGLLDEGSRAAAGSKLRASALFLQATFEGETGELAKAEATYHETILLARTSHHVRPLALSYEGLSQRVYARRGEFVQAQAAAETALRVAREYCVPIAERRALFSLGHAFWMQGQLAPAAAMTKELTALAAPGSICEGLACCLAGDLAQCGFCPDEAVPLYVRARTLADLSGHLRIGVMARLGLSRYYRLAGQPGTARGCATAALDLAWPSGDGFRQGLALISRGYAAWAEADLAAAERDLLAARDLFAATQASFHQARADLTLAALLHAMDRPEAPAAWIAVVDQLLDQDWLFLLVREQQLVRPLLEAYQVSTEPDVAAATKCATERLAALPPGPLTIRLLGGLEVYQGARRVPDAALRQRRAGDLLAWLVLRPQRMATCDRVMAALWPDADPKAARVLFHHATSSLRHALQPDLPERCPSCYLDVIEGQAWLHLPPGSSVDCEEFTELARGERWEAAVRLYGGELLPHTPGDEWLEPMRLKLAQRYLWALLGLAAERLAAGREQEALDLARRALVCEPWQEQAAAIAMKASAGLGDRAGAARTYLRLAEALARDLGTEPGPGLRALYENIVILPGRRITPSGRIREIA